MANFNLADYETVEERLRRFWADPANADARIITVNHTTPTDRQVGMWVIECRIYLSTGDQAADLPKATGWAYELDGGKGANLTSALENCETSAIGRCLGNMNYSGNKRATREEMAKVERGKTPAKATEQKNPADAIKLVSDAVTLDQLRDIWSQYADVLDVDFQHPYGDIINLKQMILNRKAEMEANKIG
jgi:hypothetical protein